MSFYNEFLIKTLQERIAYFKNVGFAKEAELLQARLKSIENNPAETLAATAPQAFFQNPVAEIASKNLQAKLAAETRRFPELERQYILENLGKAKTLKELEPLRIAYIERLLKISRANRSEKIAPIFRDGTEISTGPYNNDKTLNEALQLIYSQDPLWIEDLKELYFSIMPLSSAAAVSKSPL
ncbi:MAG: hypothetical protein LBH25_05430 [Fibromonadaceae bacterium]|jgi:chorismate mutase|nr:hypothetical protein [Fibromonadaceae bacterium]